MGLTVPSLVAPNGESIPDAEMHAWVDGLIARLASRGPLRRVLLIPPDYTRAHSGAGPIAVHLHRRLGPSAEVVVLPALGTHAPMVEVERVAMYPGIPASAFRDHDWRDGVATLGELGADLLRELSDGRVELPVAVQVSRLLVDEPWDAILSIGQVVPHEVIGIANQVKNVLVGVGGADFIHKSHWLGAACGMEGIMGRARSPVRSLMDHAAARFLLDLPITYVMTVRSTDAGGEVVTRGLFAGGDDEAFQAAAALARAANLDALDRAPGRVVVHLDSWEYKSTWLGNKAIYRTRMAIADGGELVVLAPGVRHFGEDLTIDALIREFGYRGTPATLAAVASNPRLAANLSAAAHLIHGSTEGRFRVTYAPGFLTRGEVEGVGYGYGDLTELSDLYDARRLRPGWNDLDGEEVFYVSNPALGLWGTRARFDG